MSNAQNILIKKLRAKKISREMFLAAVEPLERSEFRIKVASIAREQIQIHRIQAIKAKYTPDERDRRVLMLDLENTLG